MRFKSILGAICTCLAVVSFNVNASVFNTLNGVDYEWLELTETQGLSRDAVELRLLDPNDTLYGYQYASRVQIENLFLSYSSWDGEAGYHGDENVISGISAFLDEFGRLNTELSDGIFTAVTTVEGYHVQKDGYSQLLGLYGVSDECGTDVSCVSVMEVIYDVNGEPSAAAQDGNIGWDALHLNPPTFPDGADPGLWGSHLVRAAVVPIPSAIWLFGSGLIGLVGMARRKA